MDKDVVQQLIFDLQNHKSVIRIVTDWRNGEITAPLAMEQINYILTDSEIDDTEISD